MNHVRCHQALPAAAQTGSYMSACLPARKHTITFFNYTLYDMRLQLRWHWAGEEAAARLEAMIWSLRSVRFLFFSYSLLVSAQNTPKAFGVLAQNCVLDESRNFSSQIKDMCHQSHAGIKTIFYWIFDTIVWNRYSHHILRLLQMNCMSRETNIIWNFSC